jgi:hypothetical protein
MQTYGSRLGVRLLALVAVSASLALVAAAPASAGAVSVSGVQSPPVASGSVPCGGVDPVTGAPPVFANAMAGSLVGCWYADTLIANGAQPNGTPSGAVQFTGTETFVGCLELNGAEPCDANSANYGTLAFTFQFSGKFDPVTGAEIRGRCAHPIVSGTGVFAGASGVVTFKDDVANGTALYRAQIML